MRRSCGHFDSPPAGVSERGLDIMAGEGCNACYSAAANRAATTPPNPRVILSLYERWQRLARLEDINTRAMMSLVKLRRLSWLTAEDKRLMDVRMKTIQSRADKIGRGVDKVRQRYFNAKRGKTP